MTDEEVKHLKFDFSLITLVGTYHKVIVGLNFAVRVQINRRILVYRAIVGFWLELHPFSKGKNRGY